MYYFLLPHVAAPVTATDFPEVTKTRQTDFTIKGSVSSFRSFANSFCLHQSSSTRHVFNAFSCSYNRIIQEDNSKLTSQIFCNSFFIYHCCAKTFGSAALGRGRASFCKTLSSSVHHLSWSERSRTIWEGPLLLSQKYAWHWSMRLMFFRIIWELNSNVLHEKCN